MKKALIVEDTNYNRGLIRTILEMEKFDVIEQGNETNLLEVIRKEEPNIILMDIKCPDISGTELIRILKKQGKTAGTPIIALTAFALPNNKDGIRASGCEYLAKPFSTDELVGLIRKYS